MRVRGTLTDRVKARAAYCGTERRRLVIRVLLALPGLALAPESVALDEYSESLKHFRKVGEIGTNEEQHRASMWIRYAENAWRHVELLVAK